MSYGYLRVLYELLNLTVVRLGLYWNSRLSSMYTLSVYLDKQEVVNISQIVQDEWYYREETYTHLKVKYLVFPKGVCS